MGVLADLLQYYMSEDLAKQILKKVPYAMFAALLIYLGLITLGRGPVEPMQFSIWLGVSLLVFVAFTIPFLRAVNKPMANYFGEMDFKKLVAKMRSIYEQGDSRFWEVLGCSDRIVSVCKVGCLLRAYLAGSRG